MKPNLKKPVTITSGVAVGKDCLVKISAGSSTSGSVSVNGQSLGSYNVSNAAYKSGAFGLSTIVIHTKSTDIFTFSSYDVVGFEYLD